MPSRALIVHGTHLLQRGFVAAAESNDANGALLALTRALRRALEFKEPDAGVAILDSAPDPDMPPLLRQQLQRLPALLRVHGFTCVEASSAIDAVASYTRAALESDHDVVVVGSDKRLAQLVSDDVWWYDAYKDVRYTPELVRKRFDVGPFKVADWLALVGDDDALPGVKGIGKKGATTLLTEYDSIAAALEDLENVVGRTGKALRAEAEAARAESARALLDRNVDLPMPLTELVFEPPEAERLNAAYAELGFHQLLVASDTPSVEVTVCSTPDAARAVLDGITEPAALYALTEPPNAVRGALAGLAVSTGDGTAAYFPLLGKGNVLDSIEPLSQWLSDPGREKIGHDIKATVAACARLGVEVRGIIADTASASHLTEPSNLAPHELPEVARHRLHRPVDNDQAIRGVGRYRKRWRQIPVDTAAAFAAERADVTRALWASFEAEVDHERLDEYLALSDTLVRMELHGICCDADDLARAGDDFSTIESELEEQIYALVDKRFNLGSTKQLGSVLFEDLKLPIVKRTKTGWSTANDALERIEHAHPLVPLVLRWRRLRRLRDSWVTALVKAIDDDGRVHSTVDPARSFSGRLVNMEPDLGRVPGRTPEMQRIRHAFHAPPDHVLLSVDYDQLGLYVLAHLSKDTALVEPLQRGDDMHTLTAAAVLELPVDEIDRDRRQLGKVVNFATFAGQGASALALQLGVDASEAKQIIARFDQRYAQVRAFQEEQLRLARERGYITTIAGRRWPISGLTSLDQLTRAYAERMGRRATHEASVADVSRRGLLRADQALRAAGLRAQPLLQVHDEVLFEVPVGELTRAAELAADAMRGAFELEVPLRVGAKVGPNWAEMKPLV